MKRIPAATGLESLTPREREVLIYCSKGFTAKEVGALLKLSDHTVREYSVRIHRKLDVNTNVEAAVIAAKAGLV